MELPNQYFEDYPIEFKEINPEDFPNFEVTDKIIISPNSEGFINDILQENIDLDEKNTLVINAAVGQGKTYAIIQIIKEYYESEEDYLIFVASPFTSLVQQYCLKIEQAGIPENQIYSYDYIGNEMHIDAWESKIQVLTANALLGNPGEDSFINTQLKRDYINYLVSKCERHNRKVVIIYDEIHDAIHNFKEEYVFNLWKWRNVLHKNILLSATYNEASKVVIEYLAELTDGKIKIIESGRVRFPEKQSDLFLYFNRAKVFNNRNDELMKLVQNLVEREKSIDILSFSKILANDICQKTDEGVGKILFDGGIETQKCTSDLHQNQRTYREAPVNRYDSEKCNVGTNFKSGVSIEKLNHAFIIIMPPLGRKGPFKNSFGIFTDGVNSVIQAIARQRIKGEIHILLSPPDKFNMESLPFEDVIKSEAFENNYQLWQNYQSSSSDVDKVSYFPLINQNEILSDYYENFLRDEIREEQSFIESIERTNKVRLEYPEFKLFKLNKGEKYLASQIKFFGKDISSYVAYSAITNQFINCNLAGVNIKSPLFFKEGKIQFKLEVFFTEYMNDDFFHSLFCNVSDSYKYFQVKNDIFENHKILIKNENGNYIEVQPWSNQEFELQFIAFIQRKFKPRNRKFVKKFNNEGFYIDATYSRGEYFLSCISHSLRLSDLGEESDLMKAYISLNYFRQKVIDSVENYGTGNKQFAYLKSSIPSEFIDDNDLLRFREMKEILIFKDQFIAKNIFNFSNNFNRQENSEEESKQIKGFYKMLKKDFFITTQKRINTNELNENVSKIIKIMDVPNPNDVLDFISPAEPMSFNTLPEVTNFNF